VAPPQRRRPTPIPDERLVATRRRRTAVRASAAPPAVHRPRHPSFGTTQRIKMGQTPRRRVLSPRGTPPFHTPPRRPWALLHTPPCGTRTVYLWRAVSVASPVVPMSHTRLVTVAGRWQQRGGRQGHGWRRCTVRAPSSGALTLTATGLRSHRRPLCDPRAPTYLTPAEFLLPAASATRVERAARRCLSSDTLLRRRVQGCKVVRHAHRATPQAPNHAHRATPHVPNQAALDPRVARTAMYWRVYQLPVAAS